MILAVVKPAVDPLLGDVDLPVTDQHASSGGGTDRVVAHPVVGMPVGGDDHPDSPLR
jgi:hypothetical protein